MVADQWYVRILGEEMEFTGGFKTDRCLGLCQMYPGNPFNKERREKYRCDAGSGHGPRSAYCRRHAWVLYGWKPTPWWRRLFMKRDKE